VEHVENNSGQKISMCEFVFGECEPEWVYAYIRETERAFSGLEQVHCQGSAQGLSSAWRTCEVRHSACVASTRPKLVIDPDVLRLVGSLEERA